jgi:Glycosyl hydrolases family 43
VLAPWVQWAGNWAPSVVVRPNNPPASRYVMYYTARSVDWSPWGGKECTGVATSAVVDGPYVDTRSAPLICAPQAGGTIDPSPFVAADGSLSLQYVDDNGIHAQNVTPDGLALAGGEQLLARADGGYVWEVKRIEGPSMIDTPESGILLFYSVNLFTSPDYAVGVARCDTPSGRVAVSTPPPCSPSVEECSGPGARHRCNSPTARGASRSTPGTTWSATNPGPNAPSTCCRSPSPEATHRSASPTRDRLRRRPARPPQLAHAGRTAIGAFASDGQQRRREPRLSGRSSGL